MGYDAWKTTEPVDEHREDELTGPLCTSCGQREADCECLFGWSLADEVEARREDAERCVARNLQRLAGAVRPIHPRDAIKRGWLEAAAWVEEKGVGYAPDIVAANLRHRAMDQYLGLHVPGFCDACGRPAAAGAELCARHLNDDIEGDDR